MPSQCDTETISTSLKIGAARTFCGARIEDYDKKPNRLPASASLSLLGQPSLNGVLC
jgi:hypothetical protein